MYFYFHYKKRKRNNEPLSQYTELCVDFSEGGQAINAPQGQLKQTRPSSRRQDGRRMPQLEHARTDRRTTRKHNASGGTKIEWIAGAMLSRKWVLVSDNGAPSQSSPYRPSKLFRNIRNCAAFRIYVPDSDWLTDADMA